MAKIILEPGESFDHSHNCESKSVLLRGEVDFEVRGNRFSMNIGKEIDTGAGTSHVLHNVGVRQAIINCLHENLI